MDLKDYSFTVSVKPEDVYGNLELIIVPKDFDVVDFRVPRNGDDFISTSLSKRTWGPSYNSEGQPRFILRRKPPTVSAEVTATISVKDIYGKDVEIPEGYDFVRFGLSPTEAVHYILANEDRDVSFDSWKIIQGPRIILRKKAVS